MNSGFLAGKKTYITAALAVIAAWAGFATGDDTLSQAVQLTFTALLAACVRNGIATVGK